MARTNNRSEPVKITISLPAQTAAYLVKMASAGIIASHEAALAATLVVNEVEKLIASLA